MKSKKMRYVNFGENYIFHKGLVQMFLLIFTILFAVLFVRLVVADFEIEQYKHMQAPTAVENCYECALKSDAACSMFYLCEYGYGTLENLNCNCDGEWQRFTWHDIFNAVCGSE